MMRLLKWLFIMGVAAFNVFITWRSAEAIVKMYSRVTDVLSALFITPVMVAWTVIVIACWVFWIEVIKEHYGY